MRAVVQKVKRAQVRVDEREVGTIGKGYMVLLGIAQTDGEEDVAYICDKLIALRIFEDEADKLNLSIKDVGGEILLVSQFTLLGDARKGRRPSFIHAAKPEQAIPLYEAVKEKLSEYVPVKTGEFGANMDVELVNDGPVTILLESRRLF